jgi:hypothetical protein
LSGPSWPSGRQILQKNEIDNQKEGALLPMTTLAMNLVEYIQDRREVAWKTLVRVTFGTFMGGLVLLLILLYSGVPIV